MNCKNCNNNLRDSQKFCDECGAKVIQNRLKPKVLAQQVNEQFLCVDNKFLRTFIDLFRTPETVIIGYINGTRKKYIDVLQYFAIALTLAGIQLFLMKTFFIEQFENPFQIIDSSIEGSKFMQDYQNQMNTLMQDGNNFQSIMYILSVPFSAIGTWVTYYFTGFKKYNFTEHLVINLYYSAQIIIITSVFFILTSIFGINFAISGILITIITFIYQCYVFKRTTAQSTLESFAKMLMTYAVVGLQFLILLIVFVVVVIILKVLNII
ncbi:DUF3667 domain-containing protein [Winogradskyella eximia]|uniref:DUF3667 domain-containing protein n=1 Tax=Winogradskyella eximia TaxID=262006 RepID=UPI0024937C17|nr:DUF3667 domain-containing protein [Winogradskyella eximia]